MMAETTNDLLIIAREYTRTAAQWLQLLHFRTMAGAPTFSTSLSHYHEMLDPNGTDQARADACRRMLGHVKLQSLFENQKGIDSYALARPVDPYRAHWKTTERGAALAAIVQLLTSAIRAFDKALQSQET